MTTINKGTTVNTSNLQPGQLIHIYLAFYNVTSIRGFTSMLTFFCAKTIMICVFLNASKRAPFCIIRFILTTLINEQHPYKRIRVDEDSVLANSKDITNLLVDDFKISMETNSGDASWINIRNERHNRSIHNAVIADLLDIDQHENKWCCAAEISAESDRFRINSALDNISPHFAWYGKNTIIHEL